MKIAFATEEDKGIESILAYHFGRCPYYVFVDIENNEVKDVENKENPYYDRHEPGVVPQFIAREGASVIIAGGMGPRAIDWFKNLGVQPVTGISGKVKDILNEYLAGKLSGAAPCDDHER
ncbi:dinitrogenase iron-molybdenum cofactor biosynthesis protein [Thermococci archaeon]|nr:MAG: dinitrogenase iron-molybdenum cofactor biosynthesis protein [Thermococci archaeon]